MDSIENEVEDWIYLFELLHGVALDLDADEESQFDEFAETMNLLVENVAKQDTQHEIIDRLIARGYLQQLEKRLEFSFEYCGSSEFLRHKLPQVIRNASRPRRKK